MRSEGQSEMAAIDEAMRIGREAQLPVEIFHLKVSGKTRWGGMKQVVAKIQAARDSGLDIAADMYPYIAGGTALASALPPWMADGGMEPTTGSVCKIPRPASASWRRWQQDHERLGEPLPG